ncbi:Phosphatidylglycerophosphatase A [Candidatus Profftia lariciata]|uniref:phosphatidylglycerophosphatase A n=1 Tax=Candidatus Profftia lariciata TaxID=1987921 RepID=UPI001EF01D60|nr:phosphatidylglycerophosphatase A [Candidatus Profftia lariciata]UDG81747.1 Phosphatidylglycerophosphatase A [Candidatus Profftia lariciata]
MNNLWHLLATGFGSGLSSVMPGTIGSLVSIPFWLLLIHLPWQFYWLNVILSISIGCYACQYTAKDIQIHDHASIVWDEFIGMYIALSMLPINCWQWILGGFLIFRFLDIWKPWPIRWFDRNLYGGIGIILDDVIAGIFSAIIINIIHYILACNNIISC